MKMFLLSQLITRPRLLLFSLRGISYESTKEIERKFIVSDSILHYCKTKCLSQKEITLIDTYFDDCHYNLTKNDLWLRERNHVWELKAPMKDGRSDDSPPESINGIDHYLEIRKSEEICRCIAKKAGIPQLTLLESKPLSTTFLEASAGIKPFVRLISHRQRFLLDIPIKPGAKESTAISQKVYVDIDHVEFDKNYIPKDKLVHSKDVFYRIGEVELIPPILPIDITVCMSSIFSEIGISPSAVRGKLLEYIYRFHPDHYHALEQSGQLQSKGIKT